MSWNQAVAAIQTRTKLAPTVGVILGSGLGAFASELEDAVEISYGDIPGWPVSTAIGHAGKLMFGKIGETVVAVAVRDAAQSRAGQQTVLTATGQRKITRLGE